MSEILTDLWDRKLGLDANGNFHVKTGGTINVKGCPFQAAVVVTPGSPASNIALVAITVQDQDGNAIAFPFNFDLYLSDSSVGAGLTATTASGAVAAGASGVDLGDYTAKKAKRVQTTAAGLYILSITDTAKTGFYVVAQFGRELAPVVLAHLATASYG